MALIIQALASLSAATATDASTFDGSISALKSSISALESSIDSLDGASAFWERVGWSCAIVVGLGVIAEVVTIVREYLEDRHIWRRGIVRPPDRPSFRWMLFDVLATIVVVAGIFGEAGATGKVSSINSKLRSKTSELRAKSDQLLALVTLEAGSAASSALKAQGSAEAAGKVADHVAKRAESIDQELSMVQYLLEPRKVRNPDDLKKQLVQFKGKTIFFKSYFNDSDGYFLCKELVSVADAVGIVSNDQCGLLVVKPPFSLGINVFAPDLGTMLALNAAMSGVTPYGSGGGVNGTTNIVLVGRKNTAHVGETAQTRAAEKDAKAMKKAQQKNPVKR
jgi:hypothetical protein